MARGSLMRQLIIAFAIAAACVAAVLVLIFAVVAPGLHGGQLAGLVWAGVIVVVALLVGTFALVRVSSGLVGPLRRATGTIRSLTGGEEVLRLPVSGIAELRELAAAINAHAESAAAARAAAAERERLLQASRQAVRRMREYRRVPDVLEEARESIEQQLAADQAFLHVIRQGEIGPPAGGQAGWAVSPEFIRNMPPEAHAIVGELLARGESLVIQDLQGAEGDSLPPQLREPLRAAGIVSELLTPFGESSDFFGVIVALRMRRGQPWSPAEVEAVEWIAADLAQVIRQAWVHEQEDRLMSELKAVDRAKSEFIATVSHELRTPLTSIAGYVELLSDEAPGPLSGDQRRMLDAVERNTVRLRQLIGDLLTLSKVESGTFRTVMEPVNLAAIATAAVASLGPPAEEKGLRLAAAIGPPVVVDGDPGQLERLLLNLLSNAVKFTPSGGRIEVSVTAGDGSALLRISDTGIGIPEADQKNLANRFFRASNAVEQSIPGTGLGLTIVRSIVANHGGTLALESRQGHGTTATVRIPLYHSETGENVTAGAVSGPAPPPAR